MNRTRRTLLLVAAGALFLAAASQLLIPRWQAVRHEQQRLADPLRDFADRQTPQAALQSLQARIRANPQESEAWARLGEFYLWRSRYSDALRAYGQALALRGENAELRAALATVLYYQAGQRMTPQARAEIDKALADDPREVTALMLLAADAFLRADYAGAADIWQQVLDLNSDRIDRPAVIESVNMARILARRPG